MKNVLRQTFWIVVIAATIVPSAFAQNPTAYVSSDSITVGDRFGLVLVVPRSPEAHIARPIFTSSQGASTIRFGDLIIFRRLSTGQKALGAGAENILADTLVYEATTFAVDTAGVPPLRLRLVSGTDTTIVMTSSFRFPVVSLLEEAQEDIQDVTDVSPFPPAVWPWIVVLLLGLAAFLIMRYKDRFLSEPEPEEEIPEIIERPSPIDEALSGFLRLDAVAVSDESQIKSFFVDLSDIIRVFLARRIDIPAMESTTTELISDLARWRAEAAPDDHFDSRLKKILDTADLAKYADSKPAEQLCRDALAGSRELVISIDETVSMLEKKAEEERMSETAESDSSDSASQKEDDPDVVPHDVEPQVSE